MTPNPIACSAMAWPAERPWVAGSSSCPCCRPMPARHPVSRDQLEDAWFGPGEGTVRGYWNHVSGGRLALEGRRPALARSRRNAREQLLQRPRRSARERIGGKSRARTGRTRPRGRGRVPTCGSSTTTEPDGIPGSGDDDGTLDLVIVIHPFAPWEVEPVATGRAIVSQQAAARWGSLRGRAGRRLRRHGGDLTSRGVGPRVRSPAGTRGSLRPREPGIGQRGRSRSAAGRPRALVANGRRHGGAAMARVRPAWTRGAACAWTSRRS